MTSSACRNARTVLVLAAMLTAPLALSLGCSDEGTPSDRPPATKAPAPIAGQVVPGHVALTGNQPPLARPEFDVGRMDATTPLEGMSLLFAMSPAQKERSKALLAELQDPTSPRYHQWLKPADVAASFGATLEDREAAAKWLADQGFTVHGPTPTATRILFSGTVGQLEQAFHTEMHEYQIEDARHFGLAAPPQVPEAMARFVLGLHGVHDFRLRPANQGLPRGRGRPDALWDAGEYDGGGPSEYLQLAPSDFQTIYDVTPLYTAGITGSGQSLGIMGEGDFVDSDVLGFRTLYGLDTSLIPARVQVPFSGKSTISNYAYGETILDLEWSGAIAKDANITYVYTGSNHTYGVYDSTAWAIELGTLPILSISYGGCELYYSPSEDIYLETMGDAAAMEGVTVVNSSGDHGPAECEYKNYETAATQGLSVSWPSSIPSFVAVGGTMFTWGDKFPEPPITPAIASKAPFDTYWTCEWVTPSCSPNGYVPESAWNEIHYQLTGYESPYFWGVSGGGISTLFPKPYWQVGQTPAGSMRLVPDVSLTSSLAQVGYLVYAVDPPYPTLDPSGGTSCAAPSFAGILALLNQALAIKNPKSPVGLGNANPALYAINASTKGSKTPPFHDITSGDIEVPCKKGTPDCPSKAPYQYGYPATTGYDMATGIGSIDANNLVNAWTTLTPTTTKLTATPSGTTEGSTVKLSATIASNATSLSMTGSVVFYVETVDEGGLSDLTLDVVGAVTADLHLGKEGGTATASVVLPPGLLGTANIVAFYGGDANYLASWSSASPVAATSTFAVSPTSVTLAPFAQQKFKTTGGVPPVQWDIVRDNTCTVAGGYYYCGYVEPVTASEGAFQAGGRDGKTLVQGIDSEGAEVRILVTVVGTPVDGGVLPPPFDGGLDSGIDAAVDGGVEGGTVTDASADGSADAPTDTGLTDTAPPMDSAHADSGGATDARADAAEPRDATLPPEAGPMDAEARDEGIGAEAVVGVPPPGCGCRVTGQAPEGSSTGGALGGLFLGLGLVGRRRRYGSR